MKSTRRGIVVCLCALALLIAGASWGASRDPAGTAFTYQGRLTEGGVPVTGSYDFRFVLYDAEAGGSQVGSVVERTGIAVQDGLVTLDLDFGDVVSSSALWLEVAVRAAGSTTYTTLSPRQRLRPGPQGLWSARAEEAGHASSADSATNLGGHPASFFLDTSSTAQTKNATLSLVASSGYGIEAQGPEGGGHFLRTGGLGEAWLGWGSAGVEAKGSLWGAHFWDEEDSGVAEIAYGDTGILAFGHTEGGRFFDSDSSGEAWVGYGDTGIEAEGNFVGGHFRDADGSGEAWVGYTNYGIEAKGNGAGAHFFDSDGSGDAHVGFGDFGITADGDYAGGLFGDTDDSTWGEVGFSTYKIYGTGTVSFVQNHPEDAGKVIVYAAPEGDEVAVYTRGSARLDGGEVRVALGPTFRWVTDPDLGLTAYVTPREPGCTLYVPEVSTDTLVVRSTEGSDCAFDYIVWGLRIGFEDSTIVQPKQIEAFIPSMKDHRRMVAEDPELGRYTARSRFLEQRKAMGIEGAPDMSRARALVVAIHEFDPAVDNLPELPGFQEHRRETTKRNASSPAARETMPVRHEAASETAAAPRAVVSGGGPGQDLTARSFRSELGRVATRVAVASPVEPGDVLAIDPERPGALVRAASNGDPTVVGIVVETAGVTLGEGEAGEGQAHALLASPGAIVPCHVDAGYGAIVPGDLLVASPTPGYAMRASDPMPGSVVAKALEPAAGGKRTIRVLVMLR